MATSEPVDNAREMNSFWPREPGKSGQILRVGPDGKSEWVDPPMRGGDQFERGEELAEAAAGYLMSASALLRAPSASVTIAEAEKHGVARTRLSNAIRAWSDLDD